jgi:RNA polymerase-binding transcription factor DksA
MKTAQINQTNRRSRLSFETPGGCVFLGPPPSSGALPLKWRWHYGALLRLLERFMEERHTLAEDSRHPLERSSREIAESASHEFERELALAELAHTQDALYEIEAALKRIESGEYGFCQQTGKPISAARLRAVPWTRFSREAEVRLEQNGAVPRVRLGELRSLRESNARRIYNRR